MFGIQVLIPMVKMSIRSERKTSVRLKDIINTLLEISRENNSQIWRDMATRLSESKSKYADLNVSKISKFSTDGDVIVVPGKVLGGGYLERKVKISAPFVSEKAMLKIKESGSEFISLVDLAKENPKGTNLKIMR